MATYPSKAYPRSPMHSKYAEQIEGIAGLFRKERDLGFPHCVLGEGGTDYYWYVFPVEKTGN